MSAGDLITADYQVELQGVLMGADTSYPIDREDLAGFFGLAGVRASDELRARDRGAFTGIDYLGTRTIEIPVYVHGTSPTDTLQKVNALTGAWAPTEEAVPLVFRWPGRTWRLVGKPRRLTPVLDNLAGSLVPVPCQFEATDPILYDNALQSVSTGLPSSSDGRTYDRVYPLVFGDLGTGGTILATNDGTAPARPVAVITGPTAGNLDNPRIENATTEQVFELAMSIAAGDFVEIDFDAHSILLNGTASRRSALTPSSEWWELPSATTSQLDFRASAFAAGATLTLEWRHSFVG